MPRHRADTDLIASIRSGDLNAFTEIVERYQQVVCAVAFSACGRRSLSEDVAQETFVSAWKNIDKLEDSSKLRSWLCSIARNRARDALRKRRREVLTENGDGESEEFTTTQSDAPSPLEETVSLEEEQQLWHALKGIPESYREPLMLFYREGQSLNQVAEGLNLSVAAVKQRLSRGRSALRASVDQVGLCLARTRPTKTFTVGVIAAIAAQSGVAQAAMAKAATSRAVTMPRAGKANAALLLPLLGTLAVLIAAGVMLWTLIDLSPIPQLGTNSSDTASGQVLAPKGESPTRTSASHSEEFRVTGQVLNLFGQASSGAVVTISTEPARTSTSDESGHFSFEGLPAGSFSVQARSEDGASRASVLHLDRDDESLVLQLIEGSTLQLTLVDHSKGLALPGIEVQLATGAVELSATSDNDGLVQFHGITSPESLAQVRAAGFAAVDLQVVLSGEPGVHRRRINLMRGIPLSGVVRDQRGQPIADATISVQGKFEAGRRERTQSDAQGRWSFETVAQEPSMLNATHDDFAWTSIPLQVRSGMRAEATTLVMPRGKRVNGQVVFSDGSPAAGALVRSQPSGKSVIADDKGVFRLSGLEPGETSVWASHQVYGSRAVELPKDQIETSKVTLVLRDNSIRGTVRDLHGAPVVGAQVRAMSSLEDQIESEGRSESADNITNVRGEFTLGPLPKDGNFDIVAIMPDVSSAYLRMSPLRATHARPGDSNVELTLRKPGQLTGSVHGEDGKLVEFAIVMAQYTEALEFEASSPFTDTDGHFALSRVPEGRYSLALVAEGYQPKIVKNVRVRTGRTTDLGQLKLTRGRRLRGRVVDEGGLPVANARVVAGTEIGADSSSFIQLYATIDDGADPFAVQTATYADLLTDEQGYFELPNVHSRRSYLHLAAEKAGVGRSVLVNVLRRKGEVVLTLRPSGQIRGSLIGGSLIGEDVAVTALRLTPGASLKEPPLEVSTSTDGRSFQLRSLAPGTYLVAAHSENTRPDFRAAERVEVRPGESKRVTLEVSTSKASRWTEESLDDYHELVVQLCACTDFGCRGSTEDQLDELSASHDILTGPQFERLQVMDESREACQE
jgi:RNA polymerase sigma factor (sigma-70 family)